MYILRMAMSAVLPPEVAKHREAVLYPVVTEGNLRYTLSLCDVPEGGKERRIGI